MNLQISFNDLDIIDGYYYAASNRQNGLYRFNTDFCELVGNFEGEKNISNLFMQTTVYDNKIIFTPSSANSIHIYDLLAKELICVPIREEEALTGKFHGLVVWEHYVFFMCYTRLSMIKLDMDSFEIEYIRMSGANLNKEGEMNSPLLTYGYLTNNVIHAAHAYTNIIVDIDLNHGCYKERVLEEVGEKIWGYYVEGDKEYVLSSNGIFVIDKGKVVFEKREVLENGEYLFSTIKCNNKIHFLPFKYHNLAYPVEIEMSKNNKYSVKKYITDIKHTFGCIKICGEKLYIHTGYTVRLIEFDLVNNTQRIFGSSVPMEILQENKSLKLSEWIQFTRKYDHYTAHNYRGEKLAGGVKSESNSYRWYGIYWQLADSGTSS